MDQELAAGSGADNQHPFGADAAPLLGDDQLPQDQAADAHQNQGCDHGVGQHQPRIQEATIERHQGRRHQTGEDAATDDGKKLVQKRPASPNAVNAAEGEGGNENEDHYRDCRQVRSEGGWFDSRDRDSVNVKAVVVRDQQAGAHRDGVDRRPGPGYPAQAVTHACPGGHELRPRSAPAATRTRH